MNRLHGGPDAQGVPVVDFSTNANACGPCPSALRAVQGAEASRYPDPDHKALRASLAAFHAVDGARIVIAASASEFIHRFTAWVAREGGQRVWLPAQAYGEYAHAAHAWRLTPVSDPAQAQLAWLCEPSSPQGQAEARAVQVVDTGATVVLDRAYEPLRLSGACSLTPAALQRVWQLWTPNKALGLTGVRAAYAIAPLHAIDQARALDDLAASWPLGAHGVAMLQTWTTAETQQWLAQSLHTLRAWRQQQVALLTGLGWAVLPGDANYLCAAAPYAPDVSALRAAGIKLRDTTSMGLPGHWRLSVMPPEAQAALQVSLRHMERAA